jgi:hypothetical protein
MTLSDPGYVPGYTVGSWWLKSRNIDEALAFIEEGLQNNPDSFQILLTKGQILIAKARSTGEDIYAPDDALRRILAEAMAAFHLAANLALAQRPEQVNEDTPREVWSDYEEADAWAAARMSILMEKQYGVAERAIELASRYEDVLGADPAIQRVIDRIESE